MHGELETARARAAGDPRDVPRVDRMPADLDAQIDLGAFEIPAIFRTLHERGQLDPADMVRTFNMGVGLALVVAADSAEQTIQHLAAHDCHAYPIGAIVAGEKKVHYSGQLKL